MNNLYIEVEKRLRNVFGENVNIDFHDEKGDGKHFYLYIVSDIFEGKSRVERSKVVYSLLDDLLKTDYIHALRLKLKTNSEIIN
ncbi:BolA family transcriptional regulator [Candidatus Gracilibacteria bacterium]|nr:BolA family transcriptional regulator [Candidatus Gracilibacteria bacterium]